MKKIRYWIIRKLLTKPESEIIMRGMLSAYYNSTDNKCVDNELCWSIVHGIIGKERVTSSNNPS